MNRSEVLEQLGEVSEVGVGTITEEAVVEVAPKGEIALYDNGNGWLLDQQARKSFLKRLSVSNGLIKRLSPDTAGTLLTELQNRGGEMASLMLEGQVTGFAQGGAYRSIPVEQVLDAVEQGIDGPEYNRVMVLPDYEVRVELIGDRELAVQDTDTVRSGVVVQFSPIGLVNPLVQSFGLRQVCTNGLIANDVIKEYSLGSDDGDDNDDVLRWLTESSRRAYRSLDRSLEQWRVLAQEPVSASDRPRLLGSLAHDAKLRGASLNAMWAQASKNPPETAFDVLNVLTWTTSHAMNDPEKIIHAQKVGAIYVDEEFHRRRCPTCERTG